MNYDDPKLILKILITRHATRAKLINIVLLFPNPGFFFKSKNYCYKNHTQTTGTFDVSSEF